MCSTEFYHSQELAIYISLFFQNPYLGVRMDANTSLNCGAPALLRKDAAQPVAKPSAIDR